MPLNFSVISAMTSNRGIGYKNLLPWSHFKRDMDLFKDLTIGNTVIMGRKTFESIGKKPLKNRRNIIITNSISYDEKRKYSKNKDLFFSSDLMFGINYYSKGIPYVIGGEQIYNQALKSSYCDNVYLTIVNDKKNIIKTDTFFPQLNNNYKLDQILEIGSTNLNINNDDQMFDYQMLKFTKCDHQIHQVYLGEQGYLNALTDIMKKGEYSQNRTLTSTLSLFGLQFRYNLNNGFPLFTTKKMFIKGVIEELLWFLNGCTNSKLLHDKGVYIWDDNTTRQFLDNRKLFNLKEGDGGPIYGFQFRHFGADYINCDTDYHNQGFDQVTYVLDELKKDIKTHGKSRRAVINLWNAKDLDHMCLPPCHVLYQFYISNNGQLNCSMYQRSGDMGLGIPFNVASMALMTHMFAKLCDLEVGEIIHTIGDAHIYENHIEALMEQCKRTPLSLPMLKINNHHEKIEDFKFNDFELINYQHHPAIKMNMVV